MGYDDFVSEIRKNNQRSKRLRKSGAVIKGTDAPQNNRQRQMEFWRANTNLPSPKTVDKLTQKMDPYTVNKFLEQLRYNVDAQQRQVIKDFEGENPNSFENDPMAPVSPQFDSVSIKNKARDKDFFRPLDDLIDDAESKGEKVHNVLFDELAKRTDRFKDGLWEEKNNHGFKATQTGTRKNVREELEKHPIGTTPGLKRQSESDKEQAVEEWQKQENLKLKFKETFGIDHEDFFGNAFPLVRSKEEKDADRREQMKAISEATGVPIDTRLDKGEARDQLSDLTKRVDLETKKKFDNEDVWTTVVKDSRGKYRVAAMTKRDDGGTYVVEPEKDGEERYISAREWYEKIENENTVEQVREEAPKDFAKLQRDLHSGDAKKAAKAAKKLSGTLGLGESKGIPGGFTADQKVDPQIEYLKNVTEEQYLKAAEKHAKFKIKGDATTAVILEPFDRTLSSMAQTAEAWSKLDDDNKEKNRKGFSYIEAEDLGMASYDDFVKSPMTGLKKMLSGAGKGFLNNNPGEKWVHGNDSLSFKDVLRHNAERNPDNTIGDSKGFQTGVGFAADMLLDPANIVGAGIVAKPLAVAKGTAFARAAKVENVADTAVGRTAAEELSKDIPLSADDILTLTGGNIPKKFASRGERTSARVRAETTLTHLRDLSNNVESSEAKLLRENADKVYQLAKEVKATRDAIIHAETKAVHDDSIARIRQESVDKGSVSESVLKEIDINIQDDLLRSALTSHSKYRAATSRGEDTEHAPFSSFVGDELKKHPVLGKMDLDEYVDKIDTALYKQDKNYSRNYSKQKGQALKSEVDKAVQEYKLTPTAKSAERMRAAQRRYDIFHTGRREAQLTALKSGIKHQVKRHAEGIPRSILDAERHTALTLLHKKARELRLAPETQGSKAQFDADSVDAKTDYGDGPEFPEIDLNDLRTVDDVDRFLDPDNMGMSKERYLDALLGEINDYDGINFRPNGGFKDQEGTEFVRTSREGAIARALKENTNPVGDLTSWDKLGETPEVFATDEIIPEVFHFDPSSKSQRVFFSPQDFERVTGRPPLPEERMWAAQVAQDATVGGKTLGADRIARSNDARQRRKQIQQATESITVADKARRILERPQSVRERNAAEMWQNVTHTHTNDLGAKVMAIKPKGAKAPVEWASFLPDLKKNFAKAGVTVDKKYVEKSQKLKGTIDRLRAAKSREDFDIEFGIAVPANNGEFNSFAYALTEGGIAVPHNRDLMREWLWNHISRHQADNNANDMFPLATIAPEHLMFNDLFKEQTRDLIKKQSNGSKNYGISVSKAKKTEHFLYGSKNIAVADNGRWVKTGPEGPAAYPYGVTEAEYMADATKSVESLYKILKDSPFRNIKVDGKSLGDHLKQAPKGDTAKVTKDFADELWAVLNNDPETGLKALNEGWKKRLQSKDQLDRAASLKTDPKIAETRTEVADKVDEGIDWDAREQDYTLAHGQALQESLSKARNSRMFANSDLTLKATVRDGRSFGTESRRELRAVEKAMKQKQAEIKGAAIEAYGSPRPKTKDELKSELLQLEKYYNSLQKDARTADRRMRQVRDAQIETLYEESVKKIVDRAVSKQKGLEIRLGKRFFIPFPEGNSQIRKARQAQNSDLMVDLFFKDYRRMFQENIERGLHGKSVFTKKSSFDPEAQLWLFRATNNTNQVIRYNLDRIKNTVGRYSEADRIHAYRTMRVSGIRPSEAVQQSLLEEFEGLTKYFNGSYKIHGVPLQVGDLARWMPAEFALTSEGKAMLMTARNGRDVINAFRDYLSPEAVRKAKARKINTQDPIHLLWKTRVAIENAIADKTMKMSIKTTWGMPVPTVKQGIRPHPVEKQAVDAVRSLRRKGWKEVPRLSSNPDFPEYGYIFSPDLVKEINNLLDMLEPRNLDRVGEFVDNIVGEFNLKYTKATEDWKFRQEVRDDPNMSATLGGDTQQIVESFLGGFDKTTGAWKTGATIYNPGYYVRNLVGEVMTGYIGGVVNPRHYTRAWGVLKLMDGEDIQDALMSHEPWMQHLSKREANPKRFMMQVGDAKLTDEDMMVLYHDQGLKTGFLNTQRDTDLGVGKAPGKIAGAVGRSVVGKTHEGVRHLGEFAEDLPRMAHFIHAMKHAPKNLKTVESRAAYAAGEVRKYHFDYSDVTRFEQSVMARTFPFFKWTRKALPMLTQAYFVKPGKIAIYPKAADALSEYQTDHQITDEDNGNMPHYSGMVPGWIRDIGAYNIGSDAEGKDTYFNLQTPQMDAIKALTDPAALGHTLLNPAFKLPMEQAQGHTGGKIEMPVETGQERLSNLMRTTPQGSLIDKIITREDGAVLEPGNAPLDETMTAFLTGFGLYENDSTITEFDVTRNPVPQNYDVTRPPGIIGE